MKIKTYNIRSLSKKKFEELRLTCKRQNLEDQYKKTDPTAVVEAVVGSANNIVEEYRQKGYQLCYDFESSNCQHLLVFSKK